MEGFPSSGETGGSNPSRPTGRTTADLQWVRRNTRSSDSRRAGEPGAGAATRRDERTQPEFGGRAARTQWLELTNLFKAELWVRSAGGLCDAKTRPHSSTVERGKNRLKRLVRGGCPSGIPEPRRGEDAHGGRADRTPRHELTDLHKVEVAGSNPGLLNHATPHSSTVEGEKRLMRLVRADVLFPTEISLTTL